MLLAQIRLKNGESRIRTLDYAEWLQAGETLAITRVTVSPVTIPALTATAQVISDTQVSVLLGGGLTDETYSVSVEVDTAVDIPNIGNTGQTHQACIAVTIEEECAA